MTHAALSSLIGPEFDEFLGASIGEDRNGTGLSVLSAFARLNVDPWEEATSLSQMPRGAAVVRLNALIDALPSETAIDIPAKTIAADLVALLPRNEKLNVASPESIWLAADADPHGAERLHDLPAHPAISPSFALARKRCESAAPSRR
jgi:hypothetical protein